MAAPRKIEIIRLDEIEIGSNRLRPLSRARVDGLVSTIADPACPPLLPIEVSRKPGQSAWTLLDGFHRVTAYRESGRSEVEALVHDNSTITARMVELQRNLFAGELAPFEKAKHIAELYYLECSKRGLSPADDPRRLGGRPAKGLRDAEKETCDIVTQVSLSGAVGKSLGLERRQIQRYLTLYRILSPDVMEKLERFRIDLPASQLMMLAKQTPAMQAEVVERLLIPADHPDEAARARRVKTVAAALVKKVPTTDDKLYSAFGGSFGRMTPSQKKGALINLRKQLPAGFALITPDDDDTLTVIKDALGSAFKLLTDLIDGSNIADDDRLQDIAQDVQTAQIVMSRLVGGRA